MDGNFKIITGVLMKVHVWNEAVCFLFTTYLSCLGRGLDVRDAVGAGELLGLPCVHCACREVTFVSHKHHGNVVRVLHTFDLFSANWEKKKKMQPLTFYLQSFTASLAHPSYVFSDSDTSLVSQTTTAAPPLESQPPREL